jgi:hypothetical protein
MMRDTLLAMLILATLVLSIVAIKGMRDDAHQNPEWYKYKVTVTEDNGVLYYGVETMDGEFIGEVTASKLDSLVSDYNY